MTDEKRRSLRVIVQAFVAGVLVLADKLNTTQELSVQAWLVIVLLASTAVGNSLIASWSQPPH